MEGLRQKGEEGGGWQVSPALAQGNSLGQQRETGRHRQTQRDQGDRRGSKRGTEGQETETRRVRDGKRWTHRKTDTQEKLRAGVGAALEWGALGRESETGAAREGMFQKGALSQTAR